jgi:hypothetical protein
MPELTLSMKSQGAQIAFEAANRTGKKSPIAMSGPIAAAVLTHRQEQRNERET